MLVLVRFITLLTIVRSAVAFVGFFVSLHVLLHHLLVGSFVCSIPYIPEILTEFADFSIINRGIYFFAVFLTLDVVIVARVVRLANRAVGIFFVRFREELD